MTRLLYRVLFFMFSLIYLPAFFLKGKHKKGWGERMGRIPAETLKGLRGGRVVWIHAVSVGEVALAVTLASLLKQKAPGVKILFTTTTVRGREALEKAKGPDAALFFPLDYAGAVRRFIRAVSPAAVIILETEIWPCLLWELSARKIPVFLMNGRLSDRAFPSYRRLRFFLKPLLGLFTEIHAQNDAMRERFVSLGADPAKVIVGGNFKYDWHPPSTELPALFPEESGRFVLIAGSTHEGEEEKLFAVYRSLRARHPGFRLLVAPRHLERLESVEKQAAQSGVRVKRVFTSKNNGYDGESVLLLDKIGVLAGLYRLADAVFVGGSLVPTGGHNPIEPAFFAKPVFFGPSMENFAEMADEFVSAGAAVRVADAAALEREVETLLKDPARGSALGRAGRALVESRQGAAADTIERFIDLTGVAR